MSITHLPMRAVLCGMMLLSCASALRAEATLSGISLGSHVCGPALDVADLQGHVVLFEFWGVHCGPCLANIAHVSHMQSQFGRANFIVIANQCQNEPDPVARSTWQERAENDLVTVINRGDLPGSNVTGIPRCFLFDHTGKQVFDGSPADVESAVAAAMKASPGAMVAGHDFTVFKTEAQYLGTQAGPMTPVLKKLRKASAGPAGAAKDEADFLLGRVQSWQEAQLALLQKNRVSAPSQVPDALAQDIALLHGDTLGKPFEAMRTILRKDKAFAKELQAAVLLDDVKERARHFGLTGDGAEFKQVPSNQEKLIGFCSDLQDLLKQFPNTVAAAEASSLLQSWKPGA